MRAINFTLSESYASLLRQSAGCTIRYGNKAAQYKAGQVIDITFGDMYMKKRKVYTAYIDQVLVKPISLLTARDLQGENQQLNTSEDFLAWYCDAFKKTINQSDFVTVIYFSEIVA
ncbi:hypothetical protein SRRS_01650 [Sporomusa rhizae]|uniref:RNA-binding protein n=1 Tax=Sporomusa rhizae TaxID=357999 RepID=UPI00352B0293